MAKDTHYIPPYTRINGRHQETVCFLWITAAEHSNEPTCQTCARWLEQDAADTRTGEEMFGEAKP
jgi:hypothetical protein